MNYRQRAGLGIAPLLLRLALAVVFIWAGLGKIMTEIPVSGSRAAALANLGVRVPGAPVLPAPASLSPPPDAQPADAFRDPASLGSPTTSGTPPLAQIAYAPSDFPEAANVRAVYGIALWIQAAAHPPIADDGTQPRPIWPARLAQDRAPVYIAWAVTIAELAGGLFLLMGLLTRLSALGVALVMVGAIWLDQIGPAIQSGQTVLGFLPSRPAFDPEAWRPLFFQFTLLMSALAVVFAGPGTLAIDNILFGRSRRAGDDDDDEE